MFSNMTATIELPIHSILTISREIIRKPKETLEFIKYRLSQNHEK